MRFIGCVECVESGTYKMIGLERYMVNIAYVIIVYYESRNYNEGHNIYWSSILRMIFILFVPGVHILKVEVIPVTWMYEVKYTNKYLLTYSLLV